MVRTYGGLALAALLIAGCESQQARGPLATMPTGTNESVLRQQQLQNIQQDRGRAMQNPPVTGVSPGVGGIERAGTGGTGNVTAGAPTEVNPGTTGIVRRRGVGAPTR
ncbi:MAG: hypothetical protein ICV73_06135 [Acetobacteraceae bacterium]|nr:hypothetical protein [Acetobacteraceae bacterium]